MHITITGRLGSGKSTVCRIFANKYGYEIYSTGTIHRRIAAEKGLSALEMNELMATDLSFDHMIDDAVTRISREMSDRTLIFDSRMAWHFACDSFKVFMHIDPGADNLDYRNFDLIVDSATITPDALAELILAEFEKFCAAPAAYGSPRLRLSPLAIYPTATPEEMEKETGDIVVTVINGSHYAVGGGKALLDAMRQKPATVAARLADAAESSSATARIAAIGPRGTSMLRKIEQDFGFEYPEIPEVYR